MAQFTDAVNDDLNTPKHWLYQDLLKSGEAPLVIRATLARFDDVFGLDLLADRAEEPVPTDAKLLEQREAARVNKDFEAADHLRKEIAPLLAIDDTPNGPRLRRN